jgi:hypothetical protein
MCLQQQAGNAAVTSLLSGTLAVQRSPLSDGVRTAWEAADGKDGKGPFFELLRHLPTKDPEVLTFIALGAFAGSAPRGDDRWLALNLYYHGVESAWPIHLRVEREMKGWSDSHGKNEVFNLLRANGAAPSDRELGDAVHRVFAAGSDDLWLAETLIKSGPEPLWPAASIQHRAELAGKGHWAAEPGNIHAVLPFPVESGDTRDIPPVEAYFFPGTTGDRALIVGGVHGSEPQGAEVVELLRKALEDRCRAGHPPYFSTILVPVLNRRTHDRGQSAAGGRYLPRSKGDTKKEAENTGIEPNRTFPQPGEDYAAVLRRRSTQPELLYTPPRGGVARAPTGEHATSTMPPETRVLLKLIEEFKPSRIASVHAHSVDPEKLGRPGNDPGIFVDPRTTKGQDVADDTLAEKMLSKGRDEVDTAPKASSLKRLKPEHNPFLGNAGGTVHYDPNAPHAEGYSLGDWAPVPTDTRAGITTLTVEVPQGLPTRAEKVAVGTAP